MQKTYVYNGTEVKMTGRTAEKELRRGVDTLYEVKPADMECGTWKKWVRIGELYEIKNNNRTLENHNAKDEETS